MAFSGAVRIGDVNDFITPAQACVLNLDGSQNQKSKVPEGPLVSSTAPANGWKQTTTDSETNAIKISLQDCLACSGCVTTAETMLLQQQSTDELLQKLADPQVTVVATLSHQSRASLAAAFGLGVAEATFRLVGWLKRLGVVYVLDLHPARSIALQATAQDFVSRLRTAQAAQPDAVRAPSTSPTAATQTQPASSAAAGAQVQPRAVLPVLASACPGWVCYAEKTHAALLLPHMSAVRSPQGVAGTLVKSIFCTQHGLSPAETYHVAIMPCFDKKLEASRPDLTTRAPPGGTVAAPAAESCGRQHVGSEHCCQESGVGSAGAGSQRSQRDIAAPFAGQQGAGQWHDRSPMSAHSATANAVPAQTQSTQDEAAALAETDCVIASNEVYNLLVQRGADLRTEAPACLDSWLYPPCSHNASASEPQERSAQRSASQGVQSAEVQGRSNGHCSDGSFVHEQGAEEWSRLKGMRGGSGGFLEYVLRHAAHELYGLDLGDAPLSLLKRRGADLQEAEVVSTCGRHTLRGALVYGFRAMQNLVRRIKRGECAYDFVEVMACPSGCLNGGGQIGPAEKGQAATQAHVRLLDELYHDRADVQLEWPGQDRVALALTEALQAHTGQGDLAPALMAVFHEREKSVQSVALDW